MRLFRVFSVLVLVLLGLALAAAWVVPDMLDWDRYRATIESLASSALGRPVRIEGRITLELLPEPLLTAASINIEAQSDITVSARELRLGIAPGALLRGTIDARDLVLREPVMRMPWPPSWHMSPGFLAFHRPPWLGALSARIEGGSLTIGALTFSGIEANVSAGDASGGYRLAGTAQRDGAWRFTARLSDSGPDGSAGLDLTLDGMGARQGLGLRFAGLLDGEGMLAGRLDAQGPDLSRLLPAPAVPFRAGGRLTLASGLLAADELALDIGGSPARGAVALRLLPQARLDLAVAASRLDLDTWLPALLQAPKASYPVGVDLSAEAAQLRGGMLRRLRVAFDVAAAGGGSLGVGDVVLREASAVLPGDATLKLEGTLRRSDAEPPIFTGLAKLEAPEFRTTLHWLEAGGLQGGELEGGGLTSLSHLPPDALHAADLSAQVMAAPAHLSLTGLRGQVDGAVLGGSLSLDWGTRLALLGNLTTDILHLDPWLPSQVPALTAMPAWLPPFDVDLRVVAAHAVYRNTEIAPFSADLALDKRNLRLRRLEGVVQGVQVQLSGNVGEGGRISDGQLHVSTKDASVLLPFLPRAWRFPAFWRGAASLRAEAAGPPTELSVMLSGELGDLRLEAQPTLDLPHDGVSGPLTLRHPGAPRLLETLGLLGAPAWLGDGSFSLLAGLTAAKHQVKVDKLELIAGSLRANGQLLLEQSEGATPVLSGRLSAEALPLPEIYLRGPEPLPLALLRDVRANLQIGAEHVLVGLAPVLEQAQSALSLADGVLKLDGLRATLAGGALSGSMSFDVAAEPPLLHVQADLTGATLAEKPGAEKPGAEKPGGFPVELLSGQISAGLAMTASGHSPAALLSTLDGTIRLAAHDGVVAGFDLSALSDGLLHGANDAALAGALSGGTSEFQFLDGAATVHRGQFILQETHLQGPSGAAAFTGSLDAAGAAVDMRITAQPNFPGAPSPALRLTGPLEAVRRVPELAAITVWRSTMAAAEAKPQP